jgi:ABC-type multidrug transport system ATPase subunit
MPSFSVETQNLSHQFSRDEYVLKDINLQISEGSIYGFLGANGAGKTTTLRLLLGLLKNQQGNISFFGQAFQANRVSILKKVGSLIESPSFYGHLTAYENLYLLRKIYQCPTERIDQVLVLVGLSNTAKKKTSQFSLGMKQRLSIAIALLHSPSLLILDEPTNGLDPNGIVEMRDLLKKLNHEDGITIIISSHILGEIEKLVSHVGIIHKGSMVFQGDLSELMDKQQQASRIILETSDYNGTIDVLKECNFLWEESNGKFVLPIVSKQDIANINLRLVDKQIAVYEISYVKNDLERIFMDTINN